MKTDVMAATIALNKEELKELLKETKETLATDVKVVETTPTFSAVDLWNVQKRQRTATTMMRRWAN